MIELLSHWLIRNRENTGDPAVRLAYGRLCGLVGIGLNLLLFGGKLFAGTVSGSVAVTADAFNNLSDAGSSVVTLLGFQLAGKKPDPQHPFGHGRIEYISGLVVSGLILLMGVELGKSSVEKILHPEAVDFSLLAVGILVASIAVKLYMYLYNRRIGRRISSAGHGGHGHRQPVRCHRHHGGAGGYAGGTVHQLDNRRLGGPCGGVLHPLFRVSGG